MKYTVTAVIPTIGRPSLAQAVQSVLDQTRPVVEIVIVADTDKPVALPKDKRISVIRSAAPGSGAAHCRQLGIDVAGGSAVALLDDDDVWHPAKLARQMTAAESVADTDWIVSSRISVLGPGTRRRTWPRNLIRPGESVSEYLFRFSGLTAGGAALQTSTLCFPAELGRTVRWGEHGDAPHDEPSWLIRVQRTVPDVRVIQLPEVLSQYSVEQESLSRDSSDRTREYIEWGLRHLADESPRILGDYLCTSPVSAAVSAESFRGVVLSCRSALRLGKPGPNALTYAVLNAARVVRRGRRR